MSQDTAKKNYRILYIAGYGHSGTTILDILFGSTPGAFSLGEMTHMVRPGFLEEYCSCNSTLDKCPFWSKVFDQWQAVSGTNWEEYRKLRHAFDNNKTYLRALVGSFFPSKAFRRYAYLTEILYDTIHQVSGATVLVDSSKSPARPLVLAHFAKVQLLHVRRNFTGVANSEQKDIKVDLAKGLETASPPKALHKVFADWLVTNLFCTLTSLRLRGRAIRFRKWISNPRSLQRVVNFSDVDLENGLFKPAHMLAGNAIRLRPPQRIEVRRNHSYERLSKRQLLFTKLIDRLFWFYS